MAHKTLISGTAYDVKGGTDLIAGTSYQIGGGRTLVNGTAYEIGLIKEYEIKITGGSARSNVTYNGKTYYGNETLLVKDGESMTVVVANGNNGFGYVMTISLNGVVVAGGNDWGAHSYSYIFTPKGNATIAYILHDNRYYTCEITEE